jgi:hypothetical protein
MKEKTLIRLLVVLLLISMLLCGTVLALMFRQTDLHQNRFEAAKVSCLVHEEMDSKGDYTKGSVTGNQKTSITVENTGNIDAYIRLRFVSYWVDNNGNIIGKPSELPEISITNAWIKDSNGNYYCKAPVAPKKLTAELLKSPIELQADLTRGHYQVVEVFAEAIQSRPESAVEDSWNVEVHNDLITN